MKSIIFVLTVSGAAVNAILKTNDDGNAQRFTVMQVEKPEGVSADKFPFRAGDVLNIQEVLKFAAISNKKGLLTITKLIREDATGSEEMELPEVIKVTITVPENAILSINGEKQEGLSWEGYLFSGESVTYKAELTGKEPIEEKIVAAGEDITEEVEFT